MLKQLHPLPSGEGCRYAAVQPPSTLRFAPVMFAASDDAAAKNTALSLATEAAFEAVDGGPLSNARHLESLAMIWIWSAIRGPLGRTFGFALSHAKTKDT